MTHAEWNAYWNKKQAGLQKQVQIQSAQATAAAQGKKAEATQAQWNKSNIFKTNAEYQAKNQLSQVPKLQSLTKTLAQKSNSNSIPTTNVLNLNTQDNSLPKNSVLSNKLPVSALQQITTQKSAQQKIADYINNGGNITDVIKQANPNSTTSTSLTAIDAAAKKGDTDAQNIQRILALGQGALKSFTFGLSNSKYAEQAVPALTKFNAAANQAASEHPVAENVGEAIGTLPSMVVGGGALANAKPVTEWAGENVGRKIAAQAASGAADTGLYTAAGQVIPVVSGQETPQEALKQVGINAAVGGALGGLGEVIGSKVSKAATSKASAPVTQTAVATTAERNPEVATAVNKIATKIANGEKVSRDELDYLHNNVETAEPAAKETATPVTANTAESAVKSAEQSKLNNPLNISVKNSEAATQVASKAANAGSDTTTVENGLSKELGAKNVSFPYNEKLSQFYTNTIKNGDILSADEKANLNPDELKYKVTTEAENLKNSQLRIENDFNGEIKDLSDQTKKFDGEDTDTAMGILNVLTDDARKDGDYGPVQNWVKTVADKVHDNATGLQALAKYTRTPEGMAIKAETFVKDAQEKMTKVDRLGSKINSTLGNKVENETEQIVTAAKKSPKTAIQAINSLFKGNQEDADKLKQLIESGKYTKDDIADVVREKYKIPTLTGEDVSKIMDYMQQSIKAPTEKEAFELRLKAAKVAADKVPTTALEKMDNWRYMAMLGNPKTHMRNIAANAVMDLTRRAKNAVGTPLEKLIPKAERTKAILTPRDTAIKEFAKKDFDSAYYTLFKDEKNGFGGLFQRAKTIYKNPILEKLRIGNNKALDYEDMFFAKKSYTDSLAQAIKARGLSTDFLKSGTKQADTALQNVRAYALNEALKSTFRESNSLANKLNQLEHLNSKSKLGNSAAHLIVGGIVPFKKTPLNILKSGARYSPLGLIKGIGEQLLKVRTGDISASKAIDDISMGLTGTGIMTLGGYLRANNIITVKDDDTTKEQNYNSMLGNQEYALNIGGNTYTIDWIGPASMSLFAGAELYDSITSKGTASEKAEKGFGRFLTAMSNISDPLIQTSMLQGVNDIISSAKYSNNALGSATGSALTDYATQYVPTIVAQTANTISPVKRSTQATKDSVLSQYGEQTVRKVAAKIPGVNTLLEPKVDLWGREVTTGNLGQRIVQNYFSPGTYQGNKATAVDNEITRLYNKTGDTSVLPSYAAKYVTNNGKKQYLSASDYTKYQKALGGESYEALRQLLNTSDYKNANDEGKASIIAYIYKNAKEDVKDKYLNGQLK